MKLKQVFALFTVALLFLGSVGVPIYKHTCLHEQQTIRTFFLPSNHCSPESSPESIADACCEEPASTATLEEQCCVEDVSYFQFHGFHSEVLQKEFPSIWISAPMVSGNELPVRTYVFQQKKEVTFCYPPPLLPRERLIKNCVWRI